MGAWRTWVRQPRTLWLRRACFQIHLWGGLGLGAYVLMLSLTGSALVYRLELEAWLKPHVTFDASRRPLDSAAVRASVTAAYPGWTITSMGTRVRRANAALEVWVERDGTKLERMFDAYTGADLGDSRPPAVDALDWLTELHDRLLAGERGSVANAVGSAVVTLVALTGLVVWWPGRARWTRSLVVQRGTSWPRFNWDLHSALGFWSFWIIAIWAVSGVYLAHPEPFAQLVDRYSDPDAILGERPGDIVLSWLVRLHFGRFETSPLLQALWVPLGLVPAIMVGTACVMWWYRVARKRMLRADTTAGDAGLPTETTATPPRGW